jgi:hypothetical protein
LFRQHDIVHVLVISFFAALAHQQQKIKDGLGVFAKKREFKFLTHALIPAFDEEIIIINILNLFSGVHTRNVLQNVFVSLKVDTTARMCSAMMRERSEERV